MSRKRTLMPDIYKAKKRQCLAVGTAAATVAASATATPNSLDSEEAENKNDLADIPSDTKASLLYLKSLFPLEKFESRLPPVILKHQVYSIVKNRTLVDKQLNCTPLLFITHCIHPYVSLTSISVTVYPSIFEPIHISFP
ncbi:uncharacterized protein LOC106879820 [Octopus bimaculoides]|uniref:uncharacterized protein LOC106879820 n=1 Tax=Octopus bimaculoides TaxID=37653 RepID=UPI0022E305FB|nr:uncharacterized protein LOC106879820 [Octopus bimaculoides]